MNSSPDNNNPQDGAGVCRSEDDSLRRLQAVVDSMADGLIVFDMDGNVLDMNPAALRIHGFESVSEARKHLSESPETFVAFGLDGRPLPIDDWPMARVLRGETFTNFELGARRADTGKEWIGSYSGTPVRDSDGRMIQGVLTARDVTEQKRAEESLRRANALIEGITCGTEDLIAAEDSEFRYIFFNDAYKREFSNLWGKEIEVGTSMIEAMAPWPEEQSKARDLWARALGGEHFGVTMEFGPSEEKQVYDLRFDPIYDAQGAQMGAVHILRNVTERVRMEEALKESRAKLQAALDSMTDAVFISDSEGRFIDFNAACASFHRFSNKEECAKTFADYPDLLDVFMPDGTLAPVDMWAVPKALRGETDTNAEYTLRRKDSGETWVGSYSFAPIRDENGHIIGAVVVGRDITEQKLAQEEIRQRAEELETVMDVVPIAIWVGHDPECRSITGNKTANEFYEAEEGENVSATTTSIRRFFQNGRELLPEELPMQYAAAHNADVRGTEFEVEMPSGTRRTLWGYASPLRHSDGRVRGAVGAFVDVTEQRNLESHKREFYRRTIEAATDGKLIICEKNEIYQLAGTAIKSWELSSKAQVSRAVSEVKDFALEAGMAGKRVYDYLGCLTEAAANVIKHAKNGTMSLHRTDDAVICVFADNGPGIMAMSLPNVALTRGYSTTGTLGMGYKVMIHFADRVYLSTGPEGTVVAIEMKLRQELKSVPALPALFT